MSTQRGILDTSVFIATETQRPLNTSLLPEKLYVCVVTLAELEAGVLHARSLEERRSRLRTIETVQALTPLPIGTSAASHWAALRVSLAKENRRANINDIWIASVALAHRMPVVTQDSDFDVLADLSDLEVIRV